MLTLSPIFFLLSFSLPLVVKIPQYAFPGLHGKRSMLLSMFLETPGNTLSFLRWQCIWFTQAKKRRKRRRSGLQTGRKRAVLTTCLTRFHVPV